MTPLEAARRIAEVDAPQVQEWCLLCDARLTDGTTSEPIGHADNCPWLMLPQIVSTLEELERISRRADDTVRG